MRDLEVQVGDRLTYYNKPNEREYIDILYTSKDIDWFKSKNREILKIERIGSNGWYTVYEKKELLTDEEREFLKDIIKYYDDISQIKFREEKVINFCNEDSYTICGLDYPDNMKFENIKKEAFYTLKDLGLEEEVCE